jgi:hypothetical protein
MKYSKIVKETFFSVLNNSNPDILYRKIAQLDRQGWQELNTLVKENGLFPVFYKQISGINLPSDLKSSLKIQYYLRLKRNLILERETWNLLKQFKQSNILVVPLKGPILAKLLYGDVGLRQVPCDLDLLVHYSQLEKAEEVLLRMGYSLRLDFASLESQHKFRRHVSFTRSSEKSGVIFIDLHWDFRDRFTPTHIKDFWLNVKETNLDGHPVMLPSKEDLLLFLALTIISDFDFVEIRYVFDLHSLITNFRNDIDWATLEAKAKKFGLKTVSFFSLKLAKNLFHTDIPQYFLYGIRPGLIKRCVSRIWINQASVLSHRREIAASYMWRYFASSYILSDSFSGFLRNACKKIFLPASEVMGSCEHLAERVSYPIYIKRLLKPVYRLFHKL